MKGIGIPEPLPAFIFPLPPELPDRSDNMCPIQLQNPQNNFSIKLFPFNSNFPSDVSILNIFPSLTNVAVDVN